MNETIQALPSYWRGTLFRSRTEARWAVFFDAIGLRWEYEPEGFSLSDGTWYLPDFWLPDMGVWVEVKPDEGPTRAERKKIRLLVCGSGHPCLVLNGSPWPTTYRLYADEGRIVTYDVCFNEKHTYARHDGQPRMFFSPHPEDLTDSVIVSAMEAARNADLKDPGAGVGLPLGWEGVEPVV